MSAKLRTPCEMLLGTMARAYESQCGPIESEFFELGGNATLCKATIFCARIVETPCGLPDAAQLTRPTPSLVLGQQ